LLHFQAKNILKNNRNYTLKHPYRGKRYIILLGFWFFMHLFQSKKKSSFGWRGKSLGFLKQGFIKQQSKKILEDEKKKELQKKEKKRASLGDSL